MNTLSSIPQQSQFLKLLHRSALFCLLFHKLQFAESGGGLLDLTPDALPVLDAIPGINGLYVAAGFSGHGFGIAPAVGVVMANRILGEQNSICLDAFSLSRFNNFSADLQNHTPTLHG